MLFLGFLEMFVLICNNCDVGMQTVQQVSVIQIKELLWLFAGGSSEQFLIFQWQTCTRDEGRDPSAPWDW